MNTHKFKIDLPVTPETPDEIVITMDGIPIQADKLHVKAGTDGFTNVMVQVPCNVAAEFCAALIAKVDPRPDQERELLLAQLHDVAVEEFGPREDYETKAAFVKRLLELTLEHVL